MKKYGIYLSYAPTVDLRHEGLGRYLAAFLKGAAGRNDIQFILLCPSWSRDGLIELFNSEGVPKDAFLIISPDTKPWILKFFELLTFIKKKKRHKKRSGLNIFAKKIVHNFYNFFIQKLTHAHGFWGLFQILILVILSLFLVVILSPLLIISCILFFIVLVSKVFERKFKKIFNYLKYGIKKVLSSPKDSKFVFHMYKSMEEMESERMLKLANKLSDIAAWYSPTAFWPAFNLLRSPKLLCVPDVVLSDFPSGFADIGGDRFLDNFKRVEKTIVNANYYVTYSSAVKWNTLVDKYAIEPNNISVIHHAPNTLDRWVNVEGFSDINTAAQTYCKSLLLQAMKKSNNFNYSSNFSNADVKFLFYASQFRPNKNIFTLLRAYNYLLRKKFITHKLILTGRISQMPEVGKFIRKHNLQNDILCLNGLSVQQLAACYKLADLAVNPSLSEGGCPFTFTEALSVDTPVVMARIPVTEEVLVDPELQEMTFFDPYDWKDMASHIEWALNNRELLLDIQRKTYLTLSNRTWTDVVNEHISVLENISMANDKVVS